MKEKKGYFHKLWPFTEYFWKVNEEHVGVDLTCSATKLFIYEPKGGQEVLNIVLELYCYLVLPNINIQQLLPVVLKNDGHLGF